MATIAAGIRRTWFVWAAVFSAVTVVGFLIFVPGKPSGRFSEPGIACIGIAYYEFKDGKMLLVVPDDKPRIIGTVSKRDDRWEMTAPKGEVLILRCTFFTLKTGSADGTWSNTYSRYFWFSDYLESARGKLK
jgi:hypothetical protein